MTAAAEQVAAVEQVSPAKLLADELEVVHAIRELMDYRAEELAPTARHFALKAAEPLSCEVGAGAGPPGWPSPDGGRDS